MKLRYLYACWIVHMRCHKQISNWNAKCGQNSPYYEGGLEPSMLPCMPVKLILWSTFSRTLIENNQSNLEFIYI